MSNEIARTARGFRVYADFEDRYGKRFTVQESSSASDPRVWVGCLTERGHLTAEMAAHVRDALTGWLQDVGAEPPPRVPCSHYCFDLPPGEHHHGCSAEPDLEAAALAAEKGTNR